MDPKMPSLSPSVLLAFPWQPLQAPPARPVAAPLGRFRHGLRFGERLSRKINLRLWRHIGIEGAVGTARDTMHDSVRGVDQIAVVIPVRPIDRSEIEANLASWRDHVVALSVPRPLPLSDAECAQPEANTRTLARMRTRPCFRDLGRPGKPGARRMLAPLPFLIECPPVAQHPLAEDRVVLAGSGIRRCRDRDDMPREGPVE